MAKVTVPIEIVLQDPSSPIVPDTSDTANGASAPNTAVGEGGLTTTTKDSSGDGGLFGSSSANSSIVVGAAIVMVLAISAAIIILIHKYRKNKKLGKTDGECENIKITKKEKLAAVATSSLAILAAIVLVGNLSITNTNATEADESTTLETTDKIQIIANRYEDVTIVATTKNALFATTDTTFGYKVFMSMAGDTANLYLNGDTASEHYFAATESAGLDENTWGYSLNGKANYSAMLVASDPLLIKQNTSAAEDEEIDVYYTIKADKDMPFGIYKGEITYTIEGYNGFPTSLTTMQGMTTQICNAVYTPGPTETTVPTATLTDIRDDKTYTIAKLADGKCWMTQSLDLDLATTTTLTSDDTNLTIMNDGNTGAYTANNGYTKNDQNVISWTPVRNTIAENSLENSENSWQNSNNSPYSYDPGNVYYYTTGDNSPEEAISKTVCEQAHQDGSCAHYHAGNYYNWSAAVASNDTSSLADPNEGQYVNAANSICPKGWELPNGPKYTNDPFADNELNNLLISYSGVITGSRPNGCGGLLCPFYNYADGGFNKIRTAPLWLVRSGYVYDGSLYDTGNYGNYWSSTVYDSYSVYYLSFSNYSVYPAGSNNRNNGYSVRCVAQ